MSGMLGSSAGLFFALVEKRSGLMSEDVLMTLRTSTFTGSGRFLAPGLRMIILPALSESASPIRSFIESRRLPSSTMTFKLLPGIFSIRIVVPVMEAVIEAERIVAPP